MDNIKYFNVTDKPNNVSISINESIVDYQKTNRFNIDILEDLVESKAYATALLYLNENCILNLKESNFKETVEDFYKDCENLLNKNISIVEEVGIPLCDISGYKIYEGAGYILRGEGVKKIKESFELDLFPTIKDQVIKYKNEGKDKFDIEDYINGQVKQFSISKEEAEKLKKLLNEDTEGVQTDDIAPKVDQDLGTTPAKPKDKKKKYYDILLSGLDESMNSIVNKGFIKNKEGQYERNGYVLVKEGKSYKAINKNKINI